MSGSRPLSEVVASSRLATWIDQPTQNCFRNLIRDRDAATEPTRLRLDRFPETTVEDRLSDRAT
jgi:hypothetical protein